MIVAARRAGLHDRDAGARQCVVGPGSARNGPAEQRDAADEAHQALRRRALRLPVGPDASGTGTRSRQRATTPSSAKHRKSAAPVARPVSVAFRLADADARSGATSITSSPRPSPSIAGLSIRGRRPTSRFISALLAGLLGNIGMKTEDEPTREGPYPRRAWHPLLDLARFRAGAQEEHRPATASWQGSLGDGGRARRDAEACIARKVARIEPEWLEARSRAHLLKTSHGDPHWEKKQRVGGRARTRDGVRPAGLPASDGSTTPRIDPGARARASSCAKGLVETMLHRDRNQPRAIRDRVTRPRCACSRTTASRWRPSRKLEHQDAAARRADRRRAAGRVLRRARAGTTSRAVPCVRGAGTATRRRTRSSTAATSTVTS